MKTLANTVLLISAILILSACELVGPDRDTGDLRQLTAAEKSAVKSQTRFGLDLLRTVSDLDPDSNAVVSPLSVSLALGMTLNGAAGDTYEAMRTTLALEGLSDKEINEAWKSLLELLSGLDQRVTFEAANSIWYRLGFNPLETFLETNRTYFDARVEAIEFENPGAPNRMNGWINEKTHGRIPKVIERVSRDDVMYLINAIYFDGKWTVQFDPAKTRDHPFTNADGSTPTIPFMEVGAKVDYVKGDGFRAIDLPYGDGHFSMTILLPDEVARIDALLEGLDPHRWDETIRAMQPREMLVRLPRFTLESGSSLKEALARMGMEIAFTGEADFTRIEPSGDLFIDDVLHNTYIKVDEEGTEASAVTVVVISRTSAGDDDKVFQVDKPFIFAIREHHTGSLLFAGKVIKL